MNYKLIEMLNVACDEQNLLVRIHINNLRRLAMALAPIEAERYLLASFKGFNKFWQDFVHVTNDAEIGNTKNRCFFIFVDSDDVL